MCYYRVGGAGCRVVLLGKTDATLQYFKDSHGLECAPGVLVQALTFHIYEVG